MQETESKGQDERLSQLRAEADERLTQLRAEADERLTQLEEQAERPGEEWRPYLYRLYQRYGNGWPAAALERLLQLTAHYGYSGAWSEDAQERAEQEERLALHRWAREVIEAGIAFQQTAYIEH